LLVCSQWGGHFEARVAPWKGVANAYICGTRRRKSGVCTNTLALPIAETDDDVLGIVEGEVLGRRFIEELLAVVDTSPEAFTDIDEIWEYIAEDKIDAADGVVDDIFAALRTLVAAPHIGHRRPDLKARPLRFHVVRDQYSSPTHMTRVLFGSWRCFTVAAIRGNGSGAPDRGRG